MEAYFDNSATTRVFDSVRDVVVKVMTEDYGNPLPSTERAWRRSGMCARRLLI